MVDLKPFRGLFYNQSKVGDLSRVVTLPYDIISESKQKRYYDASKYNYVRLILGLEQPGDDDKNNKYKRAASFLEDWVKEKVLVLDAKPGFYVYEQDYEIEGVKKKQVGFISLVKLEPFEKGVILPHEQIYEKPLVDRHMLLKETRASLESIIGIYSDPARDTTRILEDAMQAAPRIDLAHDDCVRNRVWQVNDKKMIERLAALMADKKVIIADGHHRYNTALKYFKEEGRGDCPCGYIMMLLYNMDDVLTIMPTHRVLKNIPSFNPEVAKKKFGEYFRVEDFEFSERTKENALKGMFDSLDAKKDKHAFGVYMGGGKFSLILLKGRGMIQDFVDNTKSMQWNEMDVTILHSLVIEYLLGVKRDDMENIRYLKDKLKAVELVDSGGWEVAFFLNATKLSQVKAIAEAGEKMPQKSSYFYPKPLSGLVTYRF